MENLEIYMLHRWSLFLRAEIMPREKPKLTLIQINMGRAGTDLEAKASTILQKAKNTITTNNIELLTVFKYKIK